MPKIKEVLRLHFEHQRSARQIAKSCGIARSTVKEYLERAEKAGLHWPLSEDLDDAALENFRKFSLSPNSTHSPRATPDAPHGLSSSRAEAKGGDSPASLARV
jgi:DNA-binding Lrp family transcriptional regulator